MTSLSDVMIREFHRETLPLFESILCYLVVLLRIEKNSLSHIDELCNNLLTVLVDVVLHFDFFILLVR